MCVFFFFAKLDVPRKSLEFCVLACLSPNYVQVNLRIYVYRYIMRGLTFNFFLPFLPINLSFKTLSKLPELKLLSCHKLSIEYLGPQTLVRTKHLNSIHSILGITLKCN